MRRVDPRRHSRESPTPEESKLYGGVGQPGVRNLKGAGFAASLAREARRSGAALAPRPQRCGLGRGVSVCPPPLWQGP